MIKDTFFSLPRFMNLCRKEMVESWKSNVLRIVLLYGVMAVAMVCNGYFEYHGQKSSIDTTWPFLLATFVWVLWGFGCLSASFTMEKMKTKTGRISTLMTPVTSFEKFFSRWLICTVVFLVVFLITYKLADYTRVMVYSLAYPEKDFIAPVDLSHLVGKGKYYYTLCRTGWEFGALIAAYFFVQSLFILGSTIWSKNSFLKTFASVTVIVLGYFGVGVFMSKMLLERGVYYSFGDDVAMSEETMRGLLIAICIFLTLFNWTLAYFRFKESEIINRM
ncbi:MAG: hypothetical protein K2P55_11990 [Bacteroides acidifaciens]|uniref:hypothetical protein n=1 Tax=Bacteroides acidifaciens TaxID=85831 RepID=UPI0023CA12A4|nr:hypothetical protein [Bacteroides acidifaciens]MDE6819768.1 hypothetical protein [Bacteroides acidifaciens]MDE6987610.1 hypothetical protein [Bacteroides acidifaciens]